MRNHEDRLRDMLSSAAKCEQYATRLGGDDDAMAYDAIVRNLEIIGEAASKLPLQLREMYSEVPWSKIVGLGTSWFTNTSAPIANWLS